MKRHYLEENRDPRPWGSGPAARAAPVGFSGQQISGDLARFRGAETDGNGRKLAFPPYGPEQNVRPPSCRCGPDSGPESPEADWTCTSISGRDGDRRPGVPEIK